MCQPPDPPETRRLTPGGRVRHASRALGVAPSTVVDRVRKAGRALDLQSVLDLRALLDARIACTAAAA